MTSVILCDQYCQGEGYTECPCIGVGHRRMAETVKKPNKGTDWTRLLTDPDLASHLGQLLQTYREVAPENREQALLQAMREIKESAVRARAAAAGVCAATVSAQGEEIAFPQPVTEAPPFEPDLFASVAGQDRRRHPRIKCFVAVELRVEGVVAPVWGNLANVSRGGCLVETATAVPPGNIVEIGLWVASGKIWVKGMILTGIVTRSSPTYGVRVKFSDLESAEKEHLREFLRFVENATRRAQSGDSYVAKLKR